MGLLSLRGVRFLRRSLSTCWQLLHKSPTHKSVKFKVTACFMVSFGLGYGGASRQGAGVKLQEMYVLYDRQCSCHKLLFNLWHFLLKSRNLFKKWILFWAGPITYYFTNKLLVYSLLVTVAESEGSRCSGRIQNDELIHYLKLLNCPFSQN